MGSCSHLPQSLIKGLQRQQEQGALTTSREPWSEQCVAFPGKVCSYPSVDRQYDFFGLLPNFNLTKKTFLFGLAV